MRLGGYFRKLAGSAIGLRLTAGLAAAEEITVGTVNNGVMIIMQKLSPQWEKETGNKVNWVILEENMLRQRVTTDIANKGGQFDIMTIGGYEPPIWGKQGWLTPLDDLGADYDYDDLLNRTLPEATIHEAEGQGRPHHRRSARHRAWFH